MSRTPCPASWRARRTAGGRPARRRAAARQKGAIRSQAIAAAATRSRPSPRSRRARYARTSPPTPHRQRPGRAAAGEERGDQAQQAGQEPAPRDEHLERHRARDRDLRETSTYRASPRSSPSCQWPGLLGETGPVADHALDQFIRHRQPVPRPALESSGVAMAEPRGGQDRGENRARWPRPPGARNRTTPAMTSSIAAVSPSRPPARAIDSRAPDSITRPRSWPMPSCRTSSGSRLIAPTEEAALEDGTAPDRQLARGGRRDEPERDQGQEQEQPRHEPTGIEPARQGHPTHRGPRRGPRAPGPAPAR